MNFQLVSAILRGKWLLHQDFAASVMPMVYSLLAKEDVDFSSFKNKGAAFDDDGDNERPLRLKVSAYGRNVYQVDPYSNMSRIPKDSIAMISIAGPLLKYGGMCSFGMTDYVAVIDEAANADNISGIILDIDSPGGQVDGTAMTADAIQRARQKKPVVSFIDDGMAASAGYWIASAGQEIYVSQGHDMVGSIGVYTTIADMNAYYRDFHKLPVREIYAPQSSDKNQDYIQALAGNDDLVKQDLQFIASQFLRTVSRNRGDKLTSTAWKTGKMFYADEAKKIGLIDGVKTFDKVVERMNQLINR